MWRVVALLLFAAVLFSFGVGVLGTINPTATADRNVPGKTTGAGKVSLTE